MKYVKSYFRAWYLLYTWAAAFWLAMKVIFYIFSFNLDPLVAIYLFYLVSFTAFGGVVREWMGNVMS